MAVNSYREDEQMKSSDKAKITKRLLSYLLYYKKEIIGVLLSMGAAIAITLINPLIIETALDDYVTDGNLPGLLKLGIFALAINVIYIILVKVRMYIMALVTNKILLKIRQELYEHIQTLSFAFFDSRPTGKILARIIGDVNSLKNVLNNFVTTLIPELITVAAVMVIMHGVLTLK